jgi:cytochrome c
MTYRSFILPAVMAALAISSVAIAQSPNATPQAAAGAKLYQSKCSSCHSIAANKIGPAHRGVFGRVAGAASGYKYSAALKGSKITWNAATLDKWLSGPQKLVGGGKMYLVVTNADERAAIIAYLKTQ